MSWDTRTILSNPYLTKAITASNKKTDKIDARILADLLRGGYIAGCYVPDQKTVEQRQLARYRKKLVQWRTFAKNSIHGTLLQGGVKIPGIRFTEAYCKKLRALNDYGIDGFLAQIDLCWIDHNSSQNRSFCEYFMSPDTIKAKYNVVGLRSVSAWHVAWQIHFI